MSYEDFVEGIKPKLEDDVSELSYEIKDGILKSVAKLAIQEYVKHNASQTLSFQDRYDQLLEEVTQSEEPFKLKTRTGRDISIQEVSSQGNLTVAHDDGSRTYIVSKNRLEKVFHAIDPSKPISNINKAIRSVIGGSNASAYWSVNEYLHNIKGTTAGI